MTIVVGIIAFVVGFVAGVVGVAWLVLRNGPIGGNVL